MGPFIYNVLQSTATFFCKLKFPHFWPSGVLHVDVVLISLYDPLALITSLLFGTRYHRLIEATVRTPDMEQQAGSKLRKEYVKAVYCHPAYLTYMQSTSCEMLAGWSTSWFQDCQEKYQQPQICRWHHPYGRKQRTKELLDEGEREWKSWLKTQHSEN